METRLLHLCIPQLSDAICSNSSQHTPIITLFFLKAAYTVMIIQVDIYHPMILVYMYIMELDLFPYIF